MSWSSRTNRISIKWVNHNGWIDIFVIKKTTFFCSYFRHISLCFYSKFDRDSSLDAEFNSTSNKYPHSILLLDPATPKTINTWKNVMMTSSSCFFRSLLFLGYRVPSKVCSVGTCCMWNQIPHPSSSPDQNLSKNTRRYVENTNKKVVFFMTNMSIQPLWLTYFIGILLVIEFQITRIYCWRVFL